MKPADEFAAWIAGAVLRSAGEEVQAIFLEDIVEQASATEELDAVVTRTITSGSIALTH